MHKHSIKRITSESKFLEYERNRRIYFKPKFSRYINACYRDIRIFNDDVFFANENGIQLLIYYYYNKLKNNTDLYSFIYKVMNMEMLIFDLLREIFYFKYFNII